jgi:hypothetical protein
MEGKAVTSVFQYTASWGPIEIGAKMSNARRISRSTVISPMFALAMMGYLSACDPIYGVKRSAPIHADPTTECVERVLRATPGIASVKYKQSTGGRPLTWTGIKSPTLVETFFYEGPNNVRGVLQYEKDYAGRFTFAQMDLRLGQSPPQEEVSATRPVMRKVEYALESQCGLVELASHVAEQCWKEECGPIALD